MIRTRHRSLVMILAACAVAFAASACTSSGSDVAGSSATTPSNSTNKSATELIAEARILAAKAQQAPSSLALTTPLNSKPAPGKNVVWISCTNFAACAASDSYMKQAAAAIGWKMETISFDADNPGTLISAMKLALQYKPVAVSFSGAAYSEWASEVPEYKRAGVAIIPVVVGPVPIGNPIIATIGSSQMYQQGGTNLADWFVANTDGKGQVLYEDVPSLGSLTPFKVGFESEVARLCPGCQVSSTSVTVAQITSGAQVGAVVSVLREHPSIHYLVTAGDWSSAFPAALKAAGLTDVKIIGLDPKVAEFTSGIPSGTEPAWWAIANVQGVWWVVDAAARFSEGMSIPDYTDLLPNQIITQENLSGVKLDSSSSYLVPFDFESEFDQLWKVS